MKHFKTLFMSILAIGFLALNVYAGSAVKIFDQQGVPKGLNIDANGNLGVQESAASTVGQSVVHKFGQAIDFDISDGAVTVWDGANDAGINQMDYVWSTSAVITQLTSSSASDTEPIEVQGLDSDYALVIQTVTLTGQTIASLTTPLIRVFRLKNVGTSDLVGTVYCHETGTVSSGVPTDLSKVKAVITLGNNQTLMALYTIPAGTTAYMKRWYISQANSSGGFFATAGIVGIRLWARPFGEVFQLKDTAATRDDYAHPYDDPLVFDEKTDIYLEVNTSVDGSSVSGGFDFVLIDNE